jgi:hypothetical protein
MRLGKGVVLPILMQALAVAAQPPARTPGGGVSVVFVEPDGETAPGELPLYRGVTDPSRLAELSGFLEDDAARWALDLYARARGITVALGGTSAQPAEYFIALVPGGNDAAVGFRLRTMKGIESRPRVAFALLGPEEWRFSNTLLHETGHVALSMLAGGREVPKREIAAIPHTVAALSDRGTAFDRGSRSASRLSSLTLRCAGRSSKVPARAIPFWPGGQDARRVLPPLRGLANVRPDLCPLR